MSDAASAVLIELSARVIVNFVWHFEEIMNFVANNLQ